MKFVNDVKSISFTENTTEKQSEHRVQEKEIDSRIEELEQGESGYKFDSKMRLAIKNFRYRNIQASSFRESPKLLLIQSQLWSYKVKLTIVSYGVFELLYKMLLYIMKE